MSDIVFKTKPYNHQKEVVEKTIDREFFALFAEQGTGKTKMTIDTWANLRDCPGLFVVAPNGVHSNWILNEIPKHFGNISHALIWDGGSTKRWARAYKEALQSKGSVVMTMNIEALRTKKGFSHAEKFLKTIPSMMVIDESTIIKNPRAIQTTRALALAPLAKYRRVLSGTPVLQGPLDLYSQMVFLSPDIWPHGSWTAFKNDFAIEKIVTQGTRTFRQIVGYRNTEKLSDIINPHAVQLKKIDCLDLPEKIYMSRTVTLTPEQTEHYLNLRSLALSMSDQGKLTTATNALTLLLRLQQITSGQLVSDEGDVTEIPTNRLATMLDIIEEAPQSKIIIWANFRADIERITKALRQAYDPESTVHFYGATSRTERDAAVKRFQEDPKCRFFVANEAASMGLTLTASDTVIYYSHSMKLGTRLQSEDRNHRIGQKNNVVYHDIVAPGTVDERVLENLRNKQDLAHMIMSNVITLKELL